MMTVFFLMALLATAFMVVVTLQNNRGEKRYFFLYYLLGVFLYVLGYCLEITSTSLGGALTAIKVMYLGGTFIGPLYLVFIANYCELNIRNSFIVTPVVSFPVLFNILIWTTEYNHLFYKEYAYRTGENVLRGLQVTEQGPLYYVVFVYTLLCMSGSLLLLFYRFLTWNKSYRRPLGAIAVMSLIPLLANAFYIVTTYVLSANPANIDLTPFILVIAVFVFHFCILRDYLFDFAPLAHSTVLDLMRDTFVYVDRKMNFIGCGESACTLFPGLYRLPKGTPIRKVDSWPTGLQDLAAASTHGEIQFTLPHKANHVYSAWVSTPDIRLGKNAFGWVVIIQDVTKTVRLMEQLKDAAYTDTLTGLYNRRHFMELATMNLERSKRERLPYSILMFDLDYFKKVNDTYGHLAGDETLRQMALQVKASVRIYDIVARYGGEEFIVFLSNAGKDVALALGERIRLSIENTPCIYEDQSLTITCSIGVAVGDASTVGDTETILGRLLKNADDALYAAKNNGRNQVVLYEPAITGNWTESEFQI
jgi:diguanylate cyclase (GGDEF)-like protein